MRLCTARVGGYRFFLNFLGTLCARIYWVCPVFGAANGPLIGDVEFLFLLDKSLFSVGSLDFFVIGCCWYCLFFGGGAIFARARVN